MIRNIFALLAPLALVACGGGSDAGGPVSGAFAGGTCTTLGGGVSLNAPNACSTGCSNSDVPRAADDNFGTFASLSFNDAATGTISITARGLNSSGGHFVGAVINLLESDSTDSNLTVRVSTLDALNQTVETGPLTGTGSGNVFGDSDLHVVGFEATVPFDGIAVEFNRSVGASSKVVQITEICRN